jgi:hypothetical protein
MATLASLGDLLGNPNLANGPSTGAGALTPPAGLGAGGLGGSGSAQDGLSQINSGASTVAGAIGTAVDSLSGGGGGAQPNGANNGAQYKKGGQVKKKYTTGGKINLGACGVSTASKSTKSNSKW